MRFGVNLDSDSSLSKEQEVSSVSGPGSNTDKPTQALKASAPTVSGRHDSLCLLPLL